MGLLKKITGFFLFSNIFIGICAVALAFTNQLTVSKEIHYDVSLWFVFFSTMFTYSVMKFRSAQGSGTDTVHRSWANENPFLSQLVLLVSMAGTVCSFFFLQPQAMFIAAVLAAVTALYGYVHVPFIRPKRKLRDFGLLKTLFVAVVWSVTTVMIPFSGYFVDTDMLLFLLLRRFLFVLALTMVFEIKDMEDDRAHGLSTLPLTIGVTNTKLLAQSILMALMLITALQSFFNGLEFENMLGINMSLLVSVFCIQPVKEETSEAWYYLVLDGMMLLQLVLVYAAGTFK